jgi:hypothetical protein
MNANDIGIIISCIALICASIIVAACAIHNRRFTGTEYHIPRVTFQVDSVAIETDDQFARENAIEVVANRDNDTNPIFITIVDSQPQEIGECEITAFAVPIINK